VLLDDASALREPPAVLGEVGPRVLELHLLDA
jgi:hypothetical protein